MEAKTLSLCGPKPSGTLTYQDETGQIYELTWFTLPNGDLDITSIVKTPFVWGQTPQVRIVNNVVFRRGIITTERAVYRTTSDGYIIVAEGGTQLIDFFQSTFPCGPKPTDPFCYHMNNAVAERVEFRATCGPHFTDPDDPNDVNVVWGDMDDDGNITSPANQQAMQWIDVWSNDEDITGQCGTGTE